MGIVHSIEPMGVFDGPGIRGVIFLFGCRLRCKYCHNPDTWAVSGDRFEEMDAERVFEKLDRYVPYYRSSKGGITVSGGEPLLQADFCSQLFDKAHGRGLSTCLDTAGFGSKHAEAPSQTETLLSQTDLVLLDIKSANPERFRWLTGQSIDRTLKFAETVSAKDIPILIRHVLVPGITDSTSDLIRLRELASSISTVTGIEILPYHTHARHKWEALDLPYELDGISPPDKETLDKAIEITKLRGC